MFAYTQLIVNYIYQSRIAAMQYAGISKHKYTRVSARKG